MMTGTWQCCPGPCDDGHHLAPHGIAGFVLANGSMSLNQSGGEVRKTIVEADLVDCMIARPGQLFYSTQIPVCLWFVTALAGRVDNVTQASYIDCVMVFDASTFILTARISLLHLIAGDYRGGMLIPDAVEREACRKGFPDAAAIRQLIEAGRIEVVAVRVSRELEKLKEDLAIDRGEAAAILLARNERADLVATDDRNAIRACRLLGLGFISTPALLVRAVEKGLIDRKEGLLKLEKLQAIGRYRQEITVLAAAAIGEVK